MADDSSVDVTLSYPWQDHDIGDRVSVDPVTAKRLVRGGVAVYSNVSAAKAAGVDPADAPVATKRK